MPSVTDNNRPGLYEDSGSRIYNGDANEYAQLWKQHNPDQDHYVHVQAGVLDWYKDLARSGVHPDTGSLVICGPGYEIQDRDLNPSIIRSNVGEHPGIILADWSTGILDNAYDSLVETNKALGPKLQLARRDFSGGLSSNLHDMLLRRIEDIQDKQGLRDFMTWLRDSVGIEEVEKHIHSVPRLATEYSRRVTRVLEVPEALDFNAILHGRAEVRFITANMLLTGMFALTEGEFRDKLIQFRPEIEEEEFVEMLGIWHNLIFQLNTKVASDFMLRALELNPTAHIFAPSDVDVNYKGIETFSRLDVAALRKSFDERGYKFRVKDEWTLDDTHEKPAHSHQMNVLLACKNGALSEAHRHHMQTLGMETLHGAEPDASVGESSDSSGSQSVSVAIKSKKAGDSSPVLSRKERLRA